MTNINDYFLPFPDVCPYNAFCEVRKGMTAELGHEPIICLDMHYVECCAYATQYRSDIMNSFTNGVSGAVLRHIRDGGLEITMAEDEEGIVGEVVVKGFDTEND